MTFNHCRHPNSILFELSSSSFPQFQKVVSLCRTRWYVSFVLLSVPFFLCSAVYPEPCTGQDKSRAFCWMKFYCVYRLAANTMSRLIMAEASSILSPSFGSPITRAAFLTSRHVSSNRWIHRTIIPGRKITKSTTNSNRWSCSGTNYIYTKLGVLVLTENDRIYFEFLMEKTDIAVVYGVEIYF